MYSQTCVQRPPLGPEKSGRWKEVPDKNEILTGRYSQVVVNSGLTVPSNLTELYLTDQYCTPL